MTSTFKLPQQTDPPLSPRQTLPTMYDLPSEYPEEPGLSDEFHIWQPQILLLTFQPSQWNPHRVFSATDMNIYYGEPATKWEVYEQILRIPFQIDTVQQEMVMMQQQIVTMQQQMATVQQQANAAENRANLAEQRGQKLAAKLQELGMNPLDLL